MKKMSRLIVLLCAFSCAFNAWGATDFNAWKSNFYKQAQKQNISKEILDRYFVKAVYLPSVIESDRAQPEFTCSFGKYMQRVISDDRIKKGREMLQKHATLLEKVEQKYGIPAHYLVAFWGIETNFGTVKGSVDILNSLSTLSFDERRSAFFSEQLITLLKIMQEEKVGVPTGSWAGAYGHFQFMPTTFYQYAVDGDGNGQRDILNSFDDAVFSAGNYLNKMGWVRAQSWGRQVILSGDLYSKTGEKHPLSDWVKWGVKRADGRAYNEKDLSIKAELILPEGKNGPAFLVYKNFDVIKRWNRSDFYALAVGVLADKINKRSTLDVKNMKVLPGLSRDDVKSMQEVLKKENFYDGNVDGVLGSGTRNAVKKYQKSHKLPADGFLSKELLEFSKKSSKSNVEQR